MSSQEALRDNKQKGFTFIELLLVMAIVLTLSVMSTVFFSRFLTQNSVANTVDQVIATLRKAQMYSMQGKQADSWSVNYSSNILTLYKGTNFVTRDASFDERFTIGSNVTISGFTTISFSRVTGIPTTSPTITISGGNNNKTITINSQGVMSR
jgi:prepilin-type N-terminal cleavage/methylation domain-containing protein